MAVKTKFTVIRPKYLVLSSNMLDEQELELCEAEAKTLATASQAENFAARTPGWSFLRMNVGVGVLRWKGVDVALYYQRQFIRYQPAEDGPVEHAPAKTLKNEDEAWMRVSLLETKSALKQAQFFTREYDQAVSEAKQYKGLADSRQRENDLLSGRTVQLEKEIEALKDALKKVRT